MTKEKLDRQEEDIFEEDSSPTDGSGSEEPSEDNPAEDSDDDSQEDPKEEIKRLKAQIDSLEKGFKKAFSEKGIKDKEEKETPRPQRDRLAEEILISKFPELGQSESALETARMISERTGEDIFATIDTNMWIVEKAQADAKADVNRQKLSNPSNKVRPDEKEPEITNEDRRIAERFFGGDIKRYLKHKQSNQ